MNAKIPPVLKPHIVQYDKCRACLIGCITNTRVYYRGQLRPDILFVGEAVGDVEIALGEPFVGPAGQLFDSLIHETGLDKYRLLFTNSIICVPSDTIGGKLRTPKNTEIVNCSKRLNDFINLTRPKHIVAVGAVAKRALEKLHVVHDSIIHPASILRQGEAGYIDHARLVDSLEKLEKKINASKS